MYPRLGWILVLIGVFVDDPWTTYDVSEQIVLSWPAFIVGGGTIIIFKVWVLSHPAAFVNVWLYGPDVVIICPFQLNVSHATIEEFPVFE